MHTAQGMSVYLNSGEVCSFPAATSITMSADALLVFGGTELLGSISRRKVWFSGWTKESPQPA